MTLIDVFEALATLLWSYAGLTLLDWGRRTARLERRHHIPASMDLLSHMVPTMILLVLVVLAGALLGLPSIVVFIAVLFPGGLAVGSHMALADLDPELLFWRSGLFRALVAFVLTAGIIAWRMYG